MTVEVLQIAGPLAWGGGEQQLHTLIEHLDRSRYASLVAVLGAEEGPRAPQLRNLGTEVVRFPASFRAPWKTTRAIVRFARERDIRLVHAHIANNGIWGRLVANRLEVPWVFTEMGFNSIRPYRLRLLERWKTRTVDRVIVNSSELGTEVSRRSSVPSELISIVPSAIDLAPYERATGQSVRSRLGVATKTPLIGTVGRIHPVKGHAVLLDAAKKIRASGQDIRIVIFRHDSTNYEAVLREAIDEHGLASIVTIASPDEGVPAAMAALDLFVLPSLSESSPVALLEAMASGLPCIATEVGGVPSVLGAGRCGVLVPPNQVEALASAITRLLDDREARLALSKEAIQQVKEHHLADRMAASVGEIYASLLGP